MPATPEIRTESALDRFYIWITEHEDWDEVFKEFSEEELSVTLDLLDTDMPEFLESVGDEMAAHLLATILEAFLSEDYTDEDTGKQIYAFDEFLEENEVDSGQLGYLSQVRATRMSYYEVTHTDPAKGEYTVSDILAKQDPVTLEGDISEGLIHEGQIIAGRIVTLDGQKTFSNGVFTLRPEDKKEAIKLYENMVKAYVDDGPKALRKDPATLKSYRNKAYRAIPTFAIALAISGALEELGDDEVMK